MYFVDLVDFIVNFGIWILYNEWKLTGSQSRKDASKEHGLITCLSPS